MPNPYLVRLQIGFVELLFQDLVPWTQQEFSKVSAKAAAVGNPTREGRGGDGASKTKPSTTLQNLTLALITCSE